jgi:hypothetical protein
MVSSRPQGAAAWANAGEQIWEAVSGTVTSFSFLTLISSSFTAPHMSTGHSGVIAGLEISPWVQSTALVLVHHPAGMGVFLSGDAPSPASFHLSHPTALTPHRRLEVLWDP